MLENYPCFKKKVEKLTQTQTKMLILKKHEIEALMFLYWELSSTDLKESKNNTSNQERSNKPNKQDKIV